MSFIYVITNKINNKQYVGKTTDTIEHRWKRHLIDSRKRTCEKRPLYNAINKYGFENFTINVLEECSIDDLSDKEQYWINKLNTYRNGYNATLGGDGTILYNYKEIAEKYKELQNQRLTADYFNCDILVVRKACQEYGIPILSCSEVNKKRLYNPIEMLDKNDTLLKIFDNQSEAARFLQENHYSNVTDYTKLSYSIGQVCKGIRKTCCGFKWKYHLA